MAEVQTLLEDAFQYSSNLENFARIVERGELGGPGAPPGRLSVIRFVRSGGSTGVRKPA